MKEHLIRMTLMILIRSRQTKPERGNDRFLKRATPASIREWGQKNLMDPKRHQLGVLFEFKIFREEMR